MKKILFAVIILSLGLLLYRLFSMDYVSIPEQINENILTISLAFLFAGFLIQSLTWWKMLQVNQKQVTIQNAIHSSGLSIFTKYIPGKIVAILSRSELIHITDKVAREDGASISLITQLTSIWVGLVFSFSGILFTYGLDGEWWTYLLLAILMVTILLFTPALRWVIENSIHKLLKKKLNLQAFDQVKILKTIPIFILNWSLWCLGFYFFCCSFYPSLHGEWIISIYFAIAATAGIVAFFTPGGLGVREGILILLFQEFGMETAQATELAIFGRLWFISGEIFIFLIAVGLSAMRLKISASESNV